MEEKVHEKIHWADAKAAQVPSDAPQRVATGITPSGPIHLGNMREVMTGDMIYKALLARGTEAELVFDDTAVIFNLHTDTVDILDFLSSLKNISGMTETVL